MSKGDAAFFGALLFALFLFSGDPDVFDALVQAARHWLVGGIKAC